jgi:hypothetical protein
VNKVATITVKGRPHSTTLLLPAVTRLATVLKAGEEGFEVYSDRDTTAGTAWGYAASWISIALKLGEEEDKVDADLQKIADFLHDVSRGPVLWGSQALVGADKVLELIKGLGD